VLCFCFACLRLVYLMLSVSLDCQFVMAWRQRRTEHRFYWQIVTDITTWNSELWSCCAIYFFYYLSFREDSLPKVHVKDISSAHLISWVTDLCLGGNLLNELKICPLHGPLVDCPLWKINHILTGFYSYMNHKGHILCSFDKLPPRQRYVTHDPLCFISSERTVYPRSR
jgi:hypothetical protein